MSKATFHAAQGAFAVAIVLLLAGCAGPFTTRPALEPLDLRIVAFNDFHGHLETPAVTRVSDPKDPAKAVLVNAGGAAYLATAVREARAGHRHSIVVAAGDLVSASPLVSSLFLDEPAVDVLGTLGLEVASVGNHEFDRGRSELLRLANGGCSPKGCVTGLPFAGAKYAYLAANVRDTATGKTLFPPYAVREFDGIPVAFIGLVLKETPTIVSRSGIAGLQFEDEADAVNALIPELKARGVEAIVVLIHQGANTTGAYNDPTCPGMTGEIIDIVKRFDKAVDLVVSAHTHQTYLCHIDGRPVTSAGSYGRFFTEIDLRIDRATRDVIGVKSMNFVVDADRIAPDQKVAALVKKYIDLAAPPTSRVVGYVNGEFAPLANSAGESGLGDVIADAQLAAARGAGARIAFMNPGGIRAPLFSKREDRGVTYGDIFTVQPFGNNLVTQTMSGAQIRRVLEQQFPRDPNKRNRILQVSAGFSYTWNASQSVGSRIVPGSVTLDGEPLRDDADYRVTINNFLAGGGDEFAAFSEGRDREGGALDVDVLENYLRAHSPLMPTKGGRIKRIE